MRLKLLFLLSLLPAVLTGCASTERLTCSSNEHPVVLDSLYFGTAQPSGIVTPDEWATFVRETVVPHFPEGLTTWTASGQWRTSAGSLEQETSYMLQLAHAENQEKDRAINHITRAYKSRFQQEAVLRLRSHACGSF